MKYPNRFPEAEAGTATEEVKALDIASLMAPEGADKAQIDSIREDIGGAPPIVPPAKPVAEAAPAITPAPATDAPASDKPVVAYAGKEFHTAVFNKLKEYTGVADADIPTDITDENFIEKLSDFVYNHTEGGTPSNLHPTAQRLQEMIDKGISPEQALGQLNSVNALDVLPPRDIMTNALKERFGKSEQRPNGWDDTKIKENVDKMEKSGVLEMEAEKVRESMRAESQQQEQTMAADVKTKADNDLKTKNIALAEKRIVLQKEISKNILNYTDVLGIPVSKAEMQEFVGDFMYLTTPEEDGIAPGQKLLQSNDNYAKALYLLLKGDTKIKGAITEAKNKTKIDYLKKLDLEPQLSTRVSEKGQDVVDLNLLDKPDGFISKPS